MSKKMHLEVAGAFVHLLYISSIICFQKQHNLLTSCVRLDPIIELCCTVGKQCLMSSEWKETKALCGAREMNYSCQEVLICFHVVVPPYLALIHRIVTNVNDWAGVSLGGPVGERQIWDRC